MLINANLTYTFKDYNNIIEGRMQSLKILVREKEYTILNIYAPNNAADNYNFLTKIEEFVTSNDSETIIIGCDFNTVIDSDIDEKNDNINACTNKRNRAKLNNIIEYNEINDIWRLKTLMWNIIHGIQILNQQYFVDKIIF